MLKALDYKDRMIAVLFQALVKMQRISRDNNEIGYTSICSTALEVALDIEKTHLQEKVNGEERDDSEISTPASTPATSTIQIKANFPRILIKHPNNFVEDIRWNSPAVTVKTTSIEDILLLETAINQGPIRLHILEQRWTKPNSR